jgi:propanol-preferring alcohol dehydrogenase
MSAHKFMRAMVLNAPRQPLRLEQRPVPRPDPNQVLIRVEACGVCRTDLHILDGELPQPKLPLIPGHEIVGTVVDRGTAASRFALGTRVGVPWLAHTDGVCLYCRNEQENLCDRASFTGYTVDGGYADYTVAYEDFCLALPGSYEPAAAAPLLCAGLIGYRTYRLAGPRVQRLGIYGFGAAAHILAQIVCHQGKELYVFTRPGDAVAQDFARRLGATWVGGSDELPPQLLDAALIFAPVGALMVQALRATRKGGVVVSGGIHMSDIPSFPYHLLWEERVIRSVANLTRRDGEEFLQVAPEVPVKVTVTEFLLKEANEALDQLRAGAFEGSAVLIMPAFQEEG